MKRWWLTIALLLSVGINIGLLTAVGARQLGRQRSEPPASSSLDEKLRRVGHHLGLEGDRRDDFLRVQRDFIDSVELRRMHLVKVRSALRRELMSAHPDPVRVGRLEGELGEAYVELERAFLDMVTQSREVLSPREHQRYLRLLGTLRSRMR